MKIPNYVLEILHKLPESYLVGGAVRDLLLGKQPQDYDITTPLLPEQVKLLFAHTVTTGEKHGTVTVVTGQGNVEVTTMRRDGVYDDNRRPETVEFTDNLIVDLSRRDFTINAMAIDIGGNIIDPFDGKEALAGCVIATVGNPDERFAEDALRMMRAIRFACQLNFRIELNTHYSIVNNRKLINNISRERIRDELCKILSSNFPARGIELLRSTGLLELILPEINNMVGFDQCNPHHHKDIYDHTLLALAYETSNNLMLRLAILLHDVGKPETFTVDDKGIGHFYNHASVGADMARNILQRLKFDNRTIDTIYLLVKEHMNKKSRNIKKLINRVGVENLDLLFNLQIIDIKASNPPHDISEILNARKEAKKILEEKQPLTVKDLKIDGYDLIALGISPGKQMGAILNELLEIVLENPKLNNRDYLIKYIRKENGRWVTKN